MSKSLITIDASAALANRMRPIHPGEILRDELAQLGLSARKFADALGVPVNRITSILNEKRAITADTALRLSRYFGGSAEFWLNLQSAYDLRRARRAAGRTIVQQVRPRAGPPSLRHPRAGKAADLEVDR